VESVFGRVLSVDRAETEKVVFHVYIFIYSWSYLDHETAKQGCGRRRIFFASASSSSWSVTLPSSLPLPHSWDFLIPLPAPDKVGRFRVRFRFQLILSKRFRFLQNFTASSFRFLRFLTQNWKVSVQKIRQVYCSDRYHNNKLAGFISTLSLQCWTPSKEAVNTIYSFSLTRPDWSSG